MTRTHLVALLALVPGLAVAQPSGGSAPGAAPAGGPPGAPAPSTATPIDDGTLAVPPVLHATVLIAFGCGSWPRALRGSLRAL